MLRKSNFHRPEDERRNAYKELLRKKSMLLNAGYDIPDFVNKSLKWEPDNIKRHTELMSEMAYNEIWKI